MRSGRPVETVLEPAPVVPVPDLRALWRSRDLVWLLARRELTLRHRQTLLGPVWVALPPVFQAAVFVVLFERLARLPTGDLPGWMFYLPAIVLWRFFAGVVDGVGGCLANNVRLIEKVYFPRLGLACVPVLGRGVDLAVGLAVVAAAALWWGTLGPGLAWALPAVAVAAALGAAVGLLVAAGSVALRDLRLGTPLALQLWMYATIIVPRDAAPPSWGALANLYALNPMLAPIELIREAVAGRGVPVDLLARFGWTAAAATVALAVAAILFERAQARAADLL